MKTLIMAAAFLGLSSAAMAQSVDPLRLDRRGFYVTGSVGSATQDRDRITLGAAAGYQFHRLGRVELQANHNFRGPADGTIVGVNAIGQYRIPGSTVTPYAMAGVGLGLGEQGAAKGADPVVNYSLGGGVRVAVSERVEIDARYRMTRPFDDKNVATREGHTFLAGVSYRF